MGKIEIFKESANYSRLPRKRLGIYNLVFSRAHQRDFENINRVSELSRGGGGS